MCESLLRAGVILLSLSFTACPASSNQCPPVPDQTVVTCAPQPLDAGGCVGLPQNPWGPNPDMGEPTNRYPLGCGVDFPNDNPYYPCSGPQQCVCSNAIADMSRWICPL